MSAQFALQGARWPSPIPRPHYAAFTGGHVDDSIDVAHRRDLYDETVAMNSELLDAERLLLHAERPRVEKRLVEGRRAVITRRPVAVRKTIVVDVVHEELEITYVPGDGGDMTAAESAPIIVRLHAEEIEIVKHVRVVEEVTLTKHRVDGVVPVKVDLRREELAIDTTAEH